MKLMFSKSCEYGLKAMLYIASKSAQDHTSTLDEISIHIGSPMAFTSKILQQLKRHQLLMSIKGKSGGYLIEKEKLSQINLFQIVSALEGDELFTKCGLGLGMCNSKNPCPIHNEYSIIRNNLKTMLKNNFLKNNIEQLNKGKTTLLRSTNILNI